jgi:lipopolysaccharide export system permease protein
VLFAAVAGVALFAFILLAGNAIKDLIGRVADGVFSVFTAFEMMLILVPYVLTYALPSGLLTAILLTLGRVSAQHEITAMRASGIGFMRIAAPALCIGVFGAALCVVNNFSFAPNAKSHYREILSDAGRVHPVNLISERTFIRQFKGAILYVGSREGGQLKDVWFWMLDDGQRVNRFLRADGGEVQWNVELNRLDFLLKNGRVEYRDAEQITKNVPALSFGFMTLDLPLDEIFKRKTFTKKPTWLNLTELLAEKKRLKGATSVEDQKRLTQVKMSIHEKASLGFSVLSFAIVAVPLGISTRRKETSANLGLALLLTFGFYFIMIVATWMEDYPSLYPELMLWLPNIAFQSLGAWMWWRLGRN